MRVRTSVAGFAVLSIKGSNGERKSGYLKGERHSAGSSVCSTETASSCFTQERLHLFAVVNCC